ncbi:MAG: ATP-binding protein [candidate division WOR-3 bacterium]
MSYDKIRNTVVGTVEFVSPREIKVLLDTEAPLSTSLNTGNPQLFPRVNGFLLIPNESGAIIGLITWIGIEYASYPKRKGYKDFDIIDLPYPLRKLSLTPLGVLKESGNGYEIERGISIFPSVGDVVIIPTKEQLQTIVQNKDENAKIKIGTSSLAANAPIFIDPNKLFGRHLAVLGNTGSGKSCTVAGLIRWSIENAQRKKRKDNQLVNARFIVLDPNGEYGNCFDDLGTVRKYAVKIREDETIKQLKVPSWLWNSWEWVSIAQASARTQRPLLRRALREMKNSKQTKSDDNEILFKNLIISIKISLLNYQRNPANLSNYPGKQNYGEFLEGVRKSLENENFSVDNTNYQQLKEDLTNKINEILNNHPKNNNYFPAFSLENVTNLLDIIKKAEVSIGELRPYEGPEEDSPVFFKNDDFLVHLEHLAQEANQQQYLDFFIMRVRSLFTDARIASVINTEKVKDLTLEQWLNDYIGDDNTKPAITIIDLSLLPSEILYLTVAVFARIVFEAHHRYKKMYGKILPSVLVIDEAHNLIKRYETDDDNISAQRLCTQIFEKIAKEGRKFGLGLVLSSQRPSELSQTVLSQCNTFILHRIVSDRDQEMVKKLVPDSMGGILNDLSILPSRKAIILGWAIPIPTLIEINELPEEQRPKSADPEFWDVWICEKERKVNWDKISEEWQEKKANETADQKSDVNIENMKEENKNGKPDIY